MIRSPHALDFSQARARFNVRFNDNYTRESLRALLEVRAQMDGGKGAVARTARAGRG